MKPPSPGASTSSADAGDRAPTSLNPHRFQALDSWRGLLAVLVVVYHFRVISHLSGFAIVKHGDVAVDFFFVLSGFVLAHAYSVRLKRGGELVIFMIRRLGRLYPLHLGALTVLVLVELAHFGLATATGRVFYRPAFEGPTSLPALAANLALVHGLGLFHNFSWNVPSWSISVELYVSVLFAILAATRISNLLLLGVFTAALIIRLTLWANKIWPYEGDLALIRGVYGFFLGVQVFKVFAYLRIKLRKIAWLLELLIPLAFIAVMSFDDHGCGFLDPFVFGLLVLIFGIEAGMVSKMLRTAVLQYLGKISYSIYMIHYIVIVLVFGIVNLFGGKIGISLRAEKGTLFMDVGSMWAGDVIQICLVAVVVICAALTYNFVETPGRSFFNRLASSWSTRLKAA